MNWFLLWATFTLHFPKRYLTKDLSTTLSDWMTKSPVIYQSIVWSCWKQKNVFSLVTPSPRVGQFWNQIWSRWRLLSSSRFIGLLVFGILFLAHSLQSPVQYLTSLTNICILVLKGLVCVYHSKSWNCDSFAPSRHIYWFYVSLEVPLSIHGFVVTVLKQWVRFFLPGFPLKKVNVCIAKLS